MHHRCRARTPRCSHSRGRRQGWRSAHQMGRATAQRRPSCRPSLRARRHVGRPSRASRTMPRTQQRSCALMRRRSSRRTRPLRRRAGTCLHHTMLALVRIPTGPRMTRTGCMMRTVPMCLRSTTTRTRTTPSQMGRRRWERCTMDELEGGVLIVSWFVVVR